MRLAVVIRRLATYKLLAPVIESALRQGADVECWHDYSHPSVGAKGYLFPAVTAAPRFVQGTPRVREYQGPSELARNIEHGGYDAVLSIGTRQSDLGVATITHTPWCLLQTGLDTPLTFGPESLLSCDRLLYYTRWWWDWSEDYYRAIGAPMTTDLSQRLRARTTFTGFAELDAVSSIDAAEVRSRWGIPSGQPVVLFLPFPQGVGKKTFWPRYVFGEPRRLRQMLNMARFGRFEYIDDVRRGVTDAAVVKALRQFCDRNGAFLLVKSRAKTPIPPYLEAVADKTLYDEGFYPATILEALAVASLCVNYYSLTVLEAAALGVPNLCVTFTRRDYMGDHDVQEHFDRFFVANEGSAFQFNGVSSTVSIAEAIARLPGQRLDEYAIDPLAQRAYSTKFIGPVRGSGSLAFDSVRSTMTVA